MTLSSKIDAQSSIGTTPPKVANRTQNKSYVYATDLYELYPETAMKTLTQAQHRTYKTCQEFVVCTCDLQLYRVAINVMWIYTDRFTNVIMRL